MSEHRHTVLVIDDDADARRALRELLELYEYRVATASDGTDALAQLRSGLVPCLILLDLRMTVMTGWEFRAQQKQDPALAAIPVIAMTTGRWKPEDLEDFAERLEKPLDLETLRGIIARYCAS